MVEDASAPYGSFRFGLQYEKGDDDDTTTTTTTKLVIYFNRIGVPLHCTRDRDRHQKNMYVRNVSICDPLDRITESPSGDDPRKHDVLEVGYFGKDTGTGTTELQAREDVHSKSICPEDKIVYIAIPNASTRVRDKGECVFFDVNLLTDSVDISFDQFGERNDDREQEGDRNEKRTDGVPSYERDIVATSESHSESHSESKYDSISNSDANSNTNVGAKCHRISTEDWRIDVVRRQFVRYGETPDVNGPSFSPLSPLSSSSSSLPPYSIERICIWNASRNLA